MVIGNSNYQFTTKLSNPVNDAQDVSAMLKSLGFSVYGGLDLDRDSFMAELARFGRDVQDSDIALFYYAGHGLQIDGENYLVPANAQIKFKEEIDLFLVSLKDVMQQMDRGSSAKLVILDACRDNPFASQMTQFGRSAVSLGQGLGRVRTEKGTFIAFATEPDAVASDGAGRNSPFTSALLHHMSTRSISVSEMMIRVRNEVIASTHDKQTPWDSSSLTDNIYLAGRDGEQAAPPVPQPQAENSLDLRGALSASSEKDDYMAAVDVNTCGAYDAFIKRYDQSLYGALALERKQKLCPSVDATKAEASSFKVATLPAETPSLAVPNEQPVSRGLPNPVVDVRGRKVQIRPIPGDDRDMGWVYINNCGMPNSEAERLRTKINGFKFKNLRLVPGEIVSFDPALQDECKRETTITAYTNSTRGAVEGLANLAENELAAVLQSRNLDARIERETDLDTISDRYRIDVWLVP